MYKYIIIMILGLLVFGCNSESTDNRESLIKEDIFYCGNIDNSQDECIHGNRIIIGNYIYFVTRDFGATIPATNYHIWKVNIDDFTDYSSTELSFTDHGYPSDLIYSFVKDRLYIVYAGTGTKITEVCPETLTLIDVVTDMPTWIQNSSMWIDENDQQLYIIGYYDENTRIYQYNMWDWSLANTFVEQPSAGHSITTDNNYVYITTAKYGVNTTVWRLSKDTLEKVSLNGDGGIHTYTNGDVIGGSHCSRVYDGYLWFGLHGGKSGLDESGGIIKIDVENLTSYTKIELNGYTGAVYGTTYHNGYLWFTCAGLKQNALAKVEPNSLDVQMFHLPANDIHYLQGPVTFDYRKRIYLSYFPDFFDDRNAYAGYMVRYHIESDTEFQHYFGYLGTDGFGEQSYIAELSNSSNIATISSPHNVEDIGNTIDLIIEAQNNDMKVILWLDHWLFGIENWGTPEARLYLRPDYLERWNFLAVELKPYIESISMFYILDEPYWSGSHVGISQSGMRTMLETVASAIRNTFFNVYVGSCFAYVSIDEDFELPESYTMVGFDYYFYPSQEIDEYFNGYKKYLTIFKNKMREDQKLFIVPGGFQYAHKKATIENLTAVADFFYDLYLKERSELVVAFLYPSVSNVLVGLIDLPELMLVYEEIGNSIINPDKIIEPKQMYTTKNTMSTSNRSNEICNEKEFSVLYDETIDKILEYNPISDEEVNLYENAEKLIEDAQIIADELFQYYPNDEKTAKHIQYLITILTKDYAELYMNIKKNE